MTTLQRRVAGALADADVWNLRETGQFSREWRWFEDRLERQRDDE